LTEVLKAATEMLCRKLHTHKLFEIPFFRPTKYTLTARGKGFYCQVFTGQLAALQEEHASMIYLASGYYQRKNPSKADCQ